MTRKRVCAVAQMGPVARFESRGSPVARMVGMMREAAGRLGLSNTLRMARATSAR